MLKSCTGARTVRGRAQQGRRRQRRHCNQWRQARRVPSQNLAITTNDMVTHSGRCHCGAVRWARALRDEGVGSGGSLKFGCASHTLEIASSAGHSASPPTCRRRRRRCRCRRFEFDAAPDLVAWDCDCELNLVLNMINRSVIQPLAASCPPAAPRFHCWWCGHLNRSLQAPSAP